MWSLCAKSQLSIAFKTVIDRQHYVITICNKKFNSPLASLREGTTFGFLNKVNFLSTLTHLKVLSLSFKDSKTF